MYSRKGLFISTLDRHKKVKTLGVLFAPLLLSIATSVGAVPTITSTFAFTENFGPNSAGFDTGHIFQIGANVIDPLGAPANIDTVTATQPPDSPISIPFLNIGAIATANYNLIKPYAGESGEWEIYVQNKQGETDTVTTHKLDDIHVIPLATGLTASGPLLAPIISWNPVLFDDDNDSNTSDEEVDFYRIRLLNDTLDQFYRTDPIYGNSVQLPAGLIEPGVTIIRLVAWDLDEGVLENKSSTFMEYTVPVPEPAILAMMALGLAGIGYRRQRSKKAA